LITDFNAARLSAGEGRALEHCGRG
jgi:hypothetical protein